MQGTGSDAQCLNEMASLKKLIRIELLKQAYDHLPLALIATAINSMALAAILWSTLDHGILLIWLSAIILVTVGRYAFIIGYRHHSSKETTSAWELRFTYGTIASGILWACLPIFLFPSNSFPEQAMMTIVLVGMSAGACITLSYHRKLLQSFLILIMLPMIIRLAMEGAFLPLVVAAMGILFMFMISIAAKMFHQNSVSNIRLGLEAQQREFNLQQAEAQYRNLFEMASDAIFIVDMDGNLINTNRVAYERLGYQKQDILTMNITQVLSPRFASGEQGRRKAIKELGSISFEAEHVRKNGSVMPVEVNAQLINFHEQEAMLRIVRDISERKQAEDKLRTLSRALEQTGESVVITDRNGSIEYINRAFTATTGYTSEDVIGNCFTLLISGKQDKRFYRNMWKTLLTGKTWQKKLTNYRKDGTKIIVIATISPIFNEAGITTNFVGALQDITEHEILEEKLNQAQKLEAIGTLVGGIAHDFNNMLAGVTGNIFLAKQKSRHLPVVTEKLEISEKLAFSASKTIQQLLTFARKGVVETTILDLGKFFRGTDQLFKATIPENITYTSSFCDQELAVRCEETQLQQSIINLLNNARDAVTCSDTPRIILKLETFTASPRFMRKHNVSHTKFAHISVKDNGCGIPAHVMGRIFEPFFTTKDVGRGSGLGLAMIYGAVTAFDGLIEIDSTPKDGTSVHIYLPVQAGMQGKPTKLKGKDPVKGQGETLLVVDDNPHVREITCLTLESLGYQVLSASDGLEAIEKFKESLGNIKLVIMDLVMPKLGGVQAYNRMQDIDSEIHAVFITGHDLHQGLNNDLPQERTRVLQKPYTTSKLSHVIREMLELKTEAV